MADKAPSVTLALLALAILAALMSLPACTESNPKVEAYTNAAYELLKDSSGPQGSKKVEQAEELFLLANDSLVFDIKDGEVYANNGVGSVSNGFRQLGHQYSLDCNYDKAELNYRRAARLAKIPSVYSLVRFLGRLFDNRSLTSLLHELAIVYIHQGRYKEAEEHLLRAYDAFGKEEKKEGHEAYYWLLADIYKGQGRYKEAEELYRRELATDKDSRHIRTSLAQVLYFQGRYEEAEHEFKKALPPMQDTIESSDPTVLAIYGKTLKRLNLPEEAERYQTLAATIREERFQIAKKILAGEEQIGTLSWGYCAEINEVLKSQRRHNRTDSS